MWFGLRDGVVRYDGYQWHACHRAGRQRLGHVEALACRSDGTMIAATLTGIFQWDKDNWKRILSLRTGWPANLSFVTESTDGSLWIGCAWGLVCVRPNGDTQVTTSEQYAELLSQMAFDRVRIFPEACLPQRDCYRGTGLFLVGDCISKLAKDSPLRAAGVHCGDRILSVNDDERLLRNLQCEPGEVLELKLRRFETDAIDQVTITTVTIDNHRFLLPAVHSLHEDSRGRLWLGMKGNRLLRSDDAGQTWQAVDCHTTPRIGRKPTAVEGRDGCLRVASIRSGEQAGSLVHTLVGDTWAVEQLTSDDPLSAPVQTADGTTWLAGSKDVYLQRQGEWTRFATAALNLPGESCQLHIARDQSLWLLGRDQYAVRLGLSPDECLSLQNVVYQCTDRTGTEWFIESASGDVLRRQQGHVTRLDAGDGMLEQALGIQPYKDGVVIAGQTQKLAALAVFDGSSWRHYAFPAVSRALSGTAICVTADDRIWVAANEYRASGFDGGVVCVDDASCQHYRPPHAPLEARAIVELPDGRMLFAGGSGLSIFDGSVWTELSEPLLRHGACNAADVDSDGTIWVATSEHGVLRGDRVASGDRLRWTSLGTESGLSSIHADKIACDRSGGVWVSTSRGLHRFDGERFSRLSLPDALGRTALIPLAEGGLWIDGQHRLMPSEAGPRVTIDADQPTVTSGGRCEAVWSGVDAWNRSPAETLAYATRLNDGPWSGFRQRTSAVFDNLPPGTHTLSVRARDEDHRISPTVATIPIVIRPRLSQTAWFRTLCAIVGVWLAWAAWRMTRSTVQLRKSHEEMSAARTRLAVEVAEKRAEFRAVCDCSPVGIFVADRAGHMSYANPRLRRIADLTDSAAPASEWLLRLHPEDADRLALAGRKAMESGRPWHDQGRLVQSDGRVISFALAAESIECDGEHIGCVGAVEDVTDKLAAERQLRESNEQLYDTLEELTRTQDVVIRSERLRALGRMAAGVAHDINNSLAPILSFSELLLQQATEPEQCRRLARLISTGVTDMAETVRRLDHFYRDAPGQQAMELVCLAELAEQTVDLTRPRWENSASREGKQITVTVDRHSAPIIRAVCSQLRAALTNLIFNAVDAIDERGAVHVHVGQEQDMATLTIRDNGRGMDANELEHCLEPFFTSKAQGSGLGLSECHGVVRQHGGTMTMESGRGQGTSVTIRVPLVPEESRTSRHAADSPEWSSCATPAVLYVEDDPQVRIAIRDMLEILGVECTFAGSGPEALRQLEHNSVDLLLCDFGLPEMNGGEVLQHVKDRWPDLPVVITSGWSESVTVNQTQPDEFLPKPVRMNDLVRVLQDHVPSVRASGN